MDMGGYLMRQLASFGIVVAALEHRDGTASFTRRSDGSELPFSPGLLRSDEQLRCRACELLAASAPGALGDRLPLNGKFFFGGHSYGGPASLLAAAQSLGSAAAGRPAGLLLLNNNCFISATWSLSQRY